MLALDLASADPGPKGESGGWEVGQGGDYLEEAVLFRATNKNSCKSQGRAVSDLVDVDQVIAMKNLETRVCVPGVTDSGRGSKRRGSESSA